MYQSEPEPNIKIMLANAIGKYQETTPEKIKFTRADQKVKEKEIERGLRDPNSWMRHYSDFISDISDKKLQDKLQFPRFISLRCLRKNYKAEHGSDSVCPQHLAPILVIQKHMKNPSSSRMTLQEWERCLKIVTVEGKKGCHSNFKKEDVEFLMGKEARLVKPKLSQNKRKIGAKAKLYTQQSLEQCESEGIELMVRDQRLLSFNLDNLTSRKVSFSVAERKNVTTALNITTAMVQKDGTTDIEKKPSPELVLLIEECLKEGVCKKRAAELIKTKKSLTRQPKENANKIRVYRQCQVCLVCCDKKKIMSAGMIRNHQKQFHEDSFMLEKLRQHEAEIFPVVKIIHAQ